ncbi:MAG: alcohol dehydrogenase catalytic domain-containing protein [Thermoanaerobaculia bacterium]
MRAVRLLRLKEPLENCDVADPRARDGEIVVDIRAAGICHSDAHYRAGGGRVNLPLTPGHEVAGVAAGTGQRVALHYLMPNGDMIGKEVDGGYAERIVVPARNAIAIPPEVPFDQAAIMMCSTATAWHALKLAEIRSTESLGIIGFGGLGVSAVQLARRIGVSRIFAADVVPEKLKIAASFGATAVTELPEVDVVLEFSGNAAAATSALRRLAPGGRLMIVAINLRRLEIDPYADILARERRIIGCADHTRDELVELMEMARRREIDLSRAITRTVALDATAINGVLDDLDAGTAHLRTVVIPSRDAVERRATARGVGGRGRPPLHCSAALGMTFTRPCRPSRAPSAPCRRI